MKTFFSLLTLIFPLLVIGQSINDSLDYPIIAKGERLLASINPDSTNAFADRIIALSSNPFDVRQAYFVKGRASFETGNPSEAIPYFQKSIVLAQTEKDNPLLLKSLIAASAAIGDQDYPNYDSVSLYLDGAQNLAAIIHDTANLAMVFIYRSNLSFLQEEFKTALENSYLCETLLNNSKFEYEKALNSYGKGNNLMEVYYRENNIAYLKEARIAYQAAVNTFNKQGRKSSEAHARNALAGCLFYFNDLDNAEKEVNESIRLGIGLNDEGILLNGYYTVSSLYEMQNNESMAILNLEKLNALLDKTGRKGDVTFIKEQFSNIDVRVSSALIKNKIEILKKQAENKELENKLIWGAFLFLLLFGISVFYSIYYKQKNRIAIQKNKLFEEEQRRLEEHQKLLKEEIDNLNKTREIEFIKAQLVGEEKGRHRIAQQIHDGVGGLLISTKWNLEAVLKEISKKENKITHRLEENLRLQEHSYLELRRVMYELERTDNKPWWEALQEFCQQLALHKNIVINYYPYNLDESATGKFGEEIRLAIQELITNALKHAKASEINIQVSQIDGEVDVIVEDDGEGFDKNKMIKGIGIRSIENRVKGLGGQYSIETKEGVGTIVFMNVPLKSKNDMEHTFYASAN